MKGVAGFLRRGSPGHSRGDESDGSGDRSNAPSWPDIQFRSFTPSTCGPVYSCKVSVNRFYSGYEAFVFSFLFLNGVGMQK